RERTKPCVSLSGWMKKLWLAAMMAPVATLVPFRTSHVPLAPFIAASPRTTAAVGMPESGAQTAFEQVNVCAVVIAVADVENEAKRTSPVCGVKLVKVLPSSYCHVPPLLRTATRCFPAGWPASEYMR